jgi:hypothetical protein
MLGRRRAATTGTPSTTTFPQGTWAPWTATIGRTATPGSGRAWAAWSASNDTARGAGASGERPCLRQLAAAGRSVEAVRAKS